ncbi:MAG: FtsX-like permease family protein [Clostridiales bacterium]|nr:FtsX-like permease family protein [Clostridiales bacterium]
MDFIKRAFLYVTKKRGKSALLFIILLVIATFVLTGLSIEKATRVTQDNLRYALGGEFEMAPDYSESNPYYKMETDEEGNFTIDTKMPVTQEIIDKVMETAGVESYDGMSQCLVSTNLDVIPGTVPVKDKYRDRVYGRFVTGTENSSFFRGGIMKLIEGSHVPADGGHVAVISKALAEKNGLRIGDSITLTVDGGDKTEIKIIGLFEVLKQEQAYTNVNSFDKLENQIFSGLQAYQELMSDSAAGYQNVVFGVDDPAQLDEIVAGLKQNDTIDWRAFKVETNNKTYQAAAAPLEKFQTLITTVLILIVAVSAVVLSLILTMWAKSRIHETGVLLSIGFRKGAVIGQYLAEVLMIAVFAFGLSFFSSNLIAGQIGNSLLQAQVQSGEEQTAPQEDNGLQIKMKDEAKQDNVVINDNGDGGESIQKNASVEPLNVAIGLDNMARLYLIGFAIIILSVGISSASVMRLKPREILSKMS